MVRELFSCPCELGWDVDGGWWFGGWFGFDQVKIWMALEPWRATAAELHKPESQVEYTDKKVLNLVS